MIKSQLRNRLKLLSKLQDGWLDGEGVALDKRALSEVEKKFSTFYPHSLPLPVIVPTIEGNLLFEWQTKARPSLDVELPNLKAEFHSFGAKNKGKEFTLTLDSEEAWKKMFSLLKEFVY